MVKLAPFSVMRGKGDNRPSTVPLVTHLFKVVEGFKEKRFCEWQKQSPGCVLKGVLKNSAMYISEYLRRSLF